MTIEEKIILIKNELHGLQLNEEQRRKPQNKTTRK